MNFFEPQNHYRQHGYFVVRDYFDAPSIDRLTAVIKRFHAAWLEVNREFYQRQAVNSAYLTNPQFLNQDDRLSLFKWISSDQMVHAVEGLFPAGMAFMNTQLFFDPFNANQKNYWHRDPQYHLSLEEQKASLQNQNVIHCRIPLFDEPGLELVPGTHKRWDSETELNTRLARNGCQVSDQLSNGVEIPLNSGDLLVFSANMIHRGLYGLDRLSLDILFCDNDPTLLQHCDPQSLPDSTMRQRLQNPGIFVKPTSTVEL